MSDRFSIDPWPHLGETRTYSAGAKKGPFLFISGINALDENGRIVGSTVAEQAEVIYEKIDTILRLGDASWSDVVKTTDYVIDRAGYRETAAIRARYLGPEFPAATGVVVKELFGRGVLIEIEAVAITA
jgi:2-iminobutanoate/2-iminopropanoate deaminase